VCIMLITERSPEWARAVKLLVLLIFGIALVCQWHGPLAIAVADGISYITSGVNLVQKGEYQNGFGEPELWFPPLYPLVIGTLSFGGSVDPVTVARLISATFSIICLLLVFRAGQHWHGSTALMGLAAAAILALTPTFQEAANASMSEATATTLFFAAFTIWLTLPSNDGVARYVVLGFFVGASYLTRPECLLLLPAWAAIDLWSQPAKPKLYRFALATAVCLVVMAPYLLWLYGQTGRLSFSGKGDVNLAVGRSLYYGTPREYIDPHSLEMGFYRPEVTAASEIRRYLHNLAATGRAYWQIYGGPLGAGVMGAMLLGIYTLLAQRHYRLLFGLISQFAYIPVMACYVSTPRYLHATLPALSILAALGVATMIQTVIVPDRRFLTRFLPLGLLGWMTLGLAEMGSRLPRWALNTARPPCSLLRDAGLRLKAIAPPGSVVYEHGRTVGYYAVQRRARLTCNDLDTVLKYIDRVEDSQTPVWLSLSSLELENYHPSIRALLDAKRAAHAPRIEISDERGKVLVFRLR
jgi:hypothetical protein